MEIKAKKLLCTLCFLVGFVALHAQSGEDKSKSIAEIKRDAHYLYAEATMKDPDEASKSAKDILEVMVVDWVQGRYPNEDIEVCIVKAKEHCQQIQTRRDKYYRSFVYVRKGDILTVSDTSEVVDCHVALTESCDSINVVEREAGPLDKTACLTPTEQRMVEIHSFYDIEPFVKELESAGRLDEYGKYATMPSDAFVYLFVYDKKGSVVAVLRNDHGEVFNLDTLQQDVIKNYKNCGAIWLQLKNNQQ